MKTDLVRFEEKLSYEPNTGCWIWAGAGTQRYGSFHFPNYPVKHSKDMVSAHKSALFLYDGVVVERPLEILHSCDNGFCCNPSHLSVGTHTDNMVDMVSKGRHKSGKEVLSAVDIIVAKQMRKDGFKVKDIAEAFGISSSQMSRVTAGMQPKWKINCKDNNESNH